MTEAVPTADPAPRANRKTHLALAALALVGVAAVVGWSQAQSARKEADATRQELAAARQEMDAMKAAFTSAGLDAAAPDALVRSIAARQREIVRLDSALVSKGAAAGARDRQLAAASEAVTRLSSAADAATAAEREASRLFRDLDGRNRMLSHRVAELTTAAVSWEAAAGKRRGELDQLLHEVEVNKALVADAAMWRSESTRLTTEKEQLARTVVALENRVVSLAAAVDFRQRQVAAATVSLSAAEADSRQALLTTLDLRAEARRLSTDIVDLGAERERVAKALVEVNNRFVPALAATTVREQQLKALAEKVTTATETNRRLTTENADLESRMEAVDARIAQLSHAASQAAEYLAAIDDILETPTVQAALSN